MSSTIAERAEPSPGSGPSIVIPTRGRPGYLEIALRSASAQAARLGAEIIVVSDGVDPDTAAVANRHSVRLIELDTPAGANAARNAGIRAARGELIVLIDDDIEVPSGWLKVILDAAAQEPDCDVFGGPIQAAIEGGGPRACGREPAPITTLDLGSEDRDVDDVWSANMVIRRRAVAAVGGFDESLIGCGEEEDWLRRYQARGGRVRYLAGAGVIHHRFAPDATVRALARAAYARGRAARRYDRHRASAPQTARELRTLAGCAWHILRRRCTNGFVMAAHSAGRLREALAE